MLPDVSGERASAREEHEEWLETHEMSAAHVGRIDEDAYTGVLVAALIGEPTAANAVLAALLYGQWPTAGGAKITRVEVPSQGPDIAIGISVNGSERLAVVEHKRFGPNNAKALSTLKRPVKEFPVPPDLGVFAQKRRKGDPDRPAVWQLDVVTCFNDWRPAGIEQIPIEACVLLDAQDREAAEVYEPLAYPERWHSVGYATFGARLRAAYDKGDGLVRSGMTPTLLGLYSSHAR
jgi:hypothetical protein